MEKRKQISDAMQKEEIRQLARGLYMSYSTTLTERKIRQIATDTIAAFSETVDESVSLRGFVNDFICAYYPNEAVVKAAFVNQVLARQSSRNTVVFELPVRGSRIDLCKFAGSSMAFEIKTEYDTFDRLPKQLVDYASSFEYVYLIVSDGRIADAFAHVPDGCGIWSYRRKRGGGLAFSLRRKAVRNVELDGRAQLGTLPLAELRREAGLFEEGKAELVHSLASSISPRRINLLFKSYFKERYCDQWQFLLRERHRIYDIDYGWFYHNNFDPDEVYNPGNSFR